ncbi:MAG: hypothetical protein CMM45_01365 [Rhodospirillaceae bacterium]|nr:hypothetical protein [Rhodospirillaceae bacterium]
MAHTNKALISLVAGMGVILLLGFGAIIAGLIFKATAPKMVMPAGAKKNNAVEKSIKAVTPQAGEIILPAGHTVENIGLSGTQIIIHTSQETGTGSVLVIDGETGQLLQRFDIGTAP